MKKITIEVDAYTIDELDEETKNKVIGKYRDINVDYEGWENLEEYKEQLIASGYPEDVEIYYTGFYLQGDGACIVCNFNEGEILNYMKKRKLLSKYKKLSRDLNRGCWAEIKLTHRGHYYYSESIDVEYSGQGELSDGAYNELEELAGYIRADAVEKANQIYKELEELYDYLTSDEAVIETIRANEFLFTKDGGRCVYL